MTKFNLILTLLFTFSIGLKAQSYIDKKGKKQLWGAISKEDLKQDDFKEWYDKNQKDHRTNLSKEDAVLLKNTRVKIYLGTWCGDTKYLVPKFIKTWEDLGLAYDQLEFIAVHNEGDLYKQGPMGETKGKNIHRVPTFIFEQQGVEIGRIVERTVFDLDTDIRAIANGDAYKERYWGVRMLDKVFKEVEPDSLHTKTVINETYKNIRREVTGHGELNTYGYVLMAQDKLQEALFVFLLNRYMFPFNPNVRDSYAEALYKTGALEQAKEHYLESFRINPKNENAVKQLALINAELKVIKEADMKKDKGSS